MDTLKEALFYETMADGRVHMSDRRATRVATLRRAREIGFEAGLRYVYEGDLPGEGGKHTYCYACKAPVIQRYGVYVLSDRIRRGKCPVTLRRQAWRCG